MNTDYIEYEEAKDLVAALVNEKTGIKATELVVCKEILAIRNCGHGIVEILDDLTKEGRIVEVEYTLPPDHDRIKSFYLPALSRVLGRPESFRLIF